MFVFFFSPFFFFNGGAVQRNRKKALEKERKEGCEYYGLVEKEINSDGRAFLSILSFHSMGVQKRLQNKGRTQAMD